MWIFTTSGFVSAVQDRADRTIVVRARDRLSLSDISEQFNARIVTTPHADYPYRLALTSQQFADWVKKQAVNIDYPNFKSAVKIYKGATFANVLNKVWSVMHGVEDGEAR
jgi:hypothetical protein